MTALHHSIGTGSFLSDMITTIRTFTSMILASSLFFGDSPAVLRTSNAMK